MKEVVEQTANQDNYASVSVRATLTENATRTLNDLPFKAGDTVKVTVSVRTPPTDDQTRYPLRGTVLRYDDPTEPVAEDAWTALQ